MYSWTDQGGDNLTLRPELTAPVVRAYIQHQMGTLRPLNRLYYIDSLFRRERPQKGRQRQFHQFGIEAIGSAYPEQDAEVITMEAISEAFNKCFVADFIFSVSRTAEDKNTNTGRIFVAKNRNGPDGLIYPIFMDTSNVQIKILPQTQMPTGTNQATTPVVLGVRAQQQLLRDKYTKLKRK